MYDQRVADLEAENEKLRGHVAALRDHMMTLDVDDHALALINHTEAAAEAHDARVRLTGMEDAARIADAHALTAGQYGEDHVQIRVEEARAIASRIRAAKGRIG